MHCDALKIFAFLSEISLTNMYYDFKMSVLLRYIFLSNHNVNKRLCGLSFGDGRGPLIISFYKKLLGN